MLLPPWPSDVAASVGPYESVLTTPPSGSAFHLAALCKSSLMPRSLQQARLRASHSDGQGGHSPLPDTFLEQLFGGDLLQSQPARSHNTGRNLG